MLSILLFYFVWKRFSDLAVRYGKTKHYGWLGIAIYVLGLLVIGMLLGILNEIFVWGIDFENSTAIRLMDIPVGIACCYIFYLILERKWKSEVVETETIDDIGTTADPTD